VQQIIKIPGGVAPPGIFFDACRRLGSQDKRLSRNVPENRKAFFDERTTRADNRRNLRNDLRRLFQKRLDQRRPGNHFAYRLFQVTPRVTKLGDPSG